MKNEKEKTNENQKQISGRHAGSNNGSKFNCMWVRISCNGRGKDRGSRGIPVYLKTKDDAEVTFTHVPEKVLAVNANAGDQLMAMGLGDKIIGRAYTNSKINPKWNDEYEKSPTWEMRLFLWKPFLIRNQILYMVVPAHLVRKIIQLMIH